MLFFTVQFSKKNNLSLKKLIQQILTIPAVASMDKLKTSLTEIRKELAEVESEKLELEKKLKKKAAAFEKLRAKESEIEAEIRERIDDLNKLLKKALPDLKSPPPSQSWADAVEQHDRKKKENPPARENPQSALMRLGSARHNFRLVSDVSQCSQFPGVMCTTNGLDWCFFLGGVVFYQRHGLLGFEEKDGKPFRFAKYNRDANRGEDPYESSPFFDEQSGHTRKLPFKIFLGSKSGKHSNAFPISGADSLHSDYQLMRQQQRDDAKVELFETWVTQVFMHLWIAKRCNY
jgi:hypothetical protein